MKVLSASGREDTFTRHALLRAITLYREGEGGRAYREDEFFAALEELFPERFNTASQPSSEPTEQVSEPTNHDRIEPELQPDTLSRIEAQLERMNTTIEGVSDWLKQRGEAK